MPEHVFDLSVDVLARSKVGEPIRKVLRTGRVRVIVDMAQLFDIAERALRNRSRRARALNGAVLAKVIESSDTPKE